LIVFAPIRFAAMTRKPPGCGRDRPLPYTARLSPAFLMEICVTHTISFRRPELRYVLSKMSVPPEADVVAQIQRLQDLGYQIVDVTPPLDGYGPGYKIVDGAPPLEGYGPNPRPQTSQLSLFRKTVPS
jgi:hypothetical protein